MALMYLMKFCLFDVRPVQHVRDPKFLITQIVCQSTGKRLLIKSGQTHLHLKSGISCRMQNEIHVKMIQYRQSMDQRPIKCPRMTMCRRQMLTAMKLRCYRMTMMTSSLIGLCIAYDSDGDCNILTYLNITFFFHLKAKDNAKFV